jgi:hypothetical protein
MASKGARHAARDPYRRAFEVDRIVVLRIVLAVVVLAFVVLIARVALQAFGGGAASEAKRIERMIGGPSEPDRKTAAPATSEPPPVARP